eukprot:6317234-Prymnesium_polylepis.1
MEKERAERVTVGSRDSVSACFFSRNLPLNPSLLDVEARNSSFTVRNRFSASIYIVYVPDPPCAHMARARAYLDTYRAASFGRGRAMAVVMMHWP